jgi:DNA-directed RNA polymerase delta subunit
VGTPASQQVTQDRYRQREKVYYKEMAPEGNQNQKNITMNYLVIVNITSTYCFLKTKELHNKLKRLYNKLNKNNTWKRDK